MLTVTNIEAKTKKITELNIVVNEPEWKEICRECSCAAKKSGWTKKDSKKLLKEIREKNVIESN